MDGKFIYILIMCMLALFMISMYRRCKNPILTFLSVTFLGILCHVTVSLTSVYTNVNIPINFYTLFCSSVLSIPGVIMMIILGII